jgi:hypothetical protein
MINLHAKFHKFSMYKNEDMELSLFSFLKFCTLDEQELRRFDYIKDVVLDEGILTNLTPYFSDL